MKKLNLLVLSLTLLSSVAFASNDAPLEGEHLKPGECVSTRASDARKAGKKVDQKKDKKVKKGDKVIAG